MVGAGGGAVVGAAVEGWGGAAVGATVGAAVVGAAVPSQQSAALAQLLPVDE